MYKAYLESTEGWRGLRIGNKITSVWEVHVVYPAIFSETTQCLPHVTLDLQCTCITKIHGHRNYMYVSNCTLLYNIYHGFVLIMNYIINFNMFFIIQEAVHSTQVYSFKKLSKQHRGCCFM